MNTLAASKSSSDELAGCSPDEERTKTSAEEVSLKQGEIPHRTKRLFFHFEIGVKYSGRTAGVESKPAAPVVARPMAAFAVGASKVPALAPDSAVTGPPPPGGDPGPPKAIAAYVNMSVGTVTGP
jgi:hypothetical protein